MKVLVLGGTKYAGVHLVRQLLKWGHDVTIATRGKTEDCFGESVKRKKIDRRNAESLREAFLGESYDAVVDNLAFSSNDVKNLLDNVKTKRYVMTSSVSVYSDFHMDLKEDEVDTKSLELKWCNFDDFSYDEIKRQAEIALFQKYSHISSVAVRFPWIFGTDDYTKRLFFYFDCVVNEKPVNIDNPDSQLSFISSHDAGRFLAWCAENDLQGYVNAGSEGTVTLRQIIDYIEKKTGKKAILSKDGENATLNGATDFSLNLNKAKAKGYKFENISDWVFATIDFWISEFTKSEANA